MCFGGFDVNIAKTYGLDVLGNTQSAMSGNKHPIERMKQSSKDKTKLRFIKKEVFERSAYIDKAHSVLSYQIVKTRLNMQDLSSNFGSKDKCSLCLLEEESTEHVLICKGVELEEISPRWLSNTSNIEIWARICQRIQLFIEKKTLISDTM